MMSRDKRTLIDTSMTLGLQSVSDDWKSLHRIAKLLAAMPLARRKRAVAWLAEWLAEIEAAEATTPPSEAPRLT
jgi:hypothetical protein